MANTLATPLWTTKETARYFVNDLVFLANVNRTYETETPLPNDPLTAMRVVLDKIDQDRR